MKRTILATLLLICPMPGFGIPNVPMAYVEVIHATPFGGPVDSRPSLTSCVANWSELSIARSLPPAAGKADFAFLEVGNSGYSKYQFVSVFDGGTSQSETLMAPESEAVNAVFANANELVGEASSAALDGNCYFLTVRKKGRQTTIAIYDDLLGSKTGQLIAALLGRR